MDYNSSFASNILLDILYFLHYFDVKIDILILEIDHLFLHLMNDRLFLTQLIL
jgi:hypothetical protein